MNALVDLTGQKFGRLSVSRVTPKRDGNNVVFECQCDCGNTVFVAGDKLKKGNNKSCGCLKVDRLYRHGLARHPLYNTWAKLIARCTVPNYPQWDYYGGRGITVCSEWAAPLGVACFIADMHPRPPGMSIDRIDNDGPYSKANCRWATDREQNSNTRQNNRITYQGKTLIVSEWARALGITKSAMHKRLKSGRPLQEIITERKTYSRGANKL